MVKSMNAKIFLLIILLFIIFGGIFFCIKKYAPLVPHQNKSKVTIIKNISYIDDTNPKHRLDIYLPKNKKDFPIVHFIHGGYWTSGDKDYYAFATGLYGNIGTTLAKNGIGVVVQNYRLSPETNIIGEVDDVLSGIEWTAQNISGYGGNPSNIYLMGHSAGGHIVTLLGTNPRLLKEKNLEQNIAGFIDLSGIIDIPGMIASSEAEFNKNVSFPVFTEQIENQKKYSPATYIKDSLPNFLIIWGEHDFPIVKSQTETLLASLKKKPPYHILPDQSHIDIVTQFGKTNDTITPIIFDFIKQNSVK